MKVAFERLDDGIIKLTPEDDEDELLLQRLRQSKLLFAQRNVIGPVISEALVQLQLIETPGVYS